MIWVGQFAHVCAGWWQRSVLSGERMKRMYIIVKVGSSYCLMFDVLIKMRVSLFCCVSARVARFMLTLSSALPV